MNRQVKQLSYGHGAKAPLGSLRFEAYSINSCTQPYAPANNRPQRLFYKIYGFSNYNNLIPHGSASSPTGSPL